MNSIMKAYVRATELTRGQTMAEYALVTAAIAAAVYAVYHVMGGDVSTLAGKTNTDLSAAAS